MQQSVADAMAPWVARLPELRAMARNNEFNTELWQTFAGAGTNTFHMKTSARKVGDKYIVNGAKQFIIEVDVADYMLLVARRRQIS
ncbi:MAG: hypothetical protein O7F73_05235 [Gammaproteobacteria bacterium]|nr:hypothetical protein [Gammaproteobacteria bacterium]